MHRNLSKSVTHTHETLLNDDQVSVIPGILIASFELEADDNLKTILESVICQQTKEKKWRDMENVKCEDSLILKIWN